MYIRANERLVIAVNKVAADMGVKVGGYCWREFMKAEYLSLHDKKIAAKYPDTVPSEFGIKCSFCLSDKCFSESHEQIDHDMHAFGLIWETHWIKVSEELYLHYAINITERKQTEKALLESENRNREIIDNSLAGYFYINQDGLFQKVNNTWLRLHKYDNADEVIGKHFGITQVGVDLESAKKIVEEILIGDQIPSGEFSRLCKDGSIGYHNFSCNKVIKDGKVIGLEGFLIDNTEHRKAELALKESENKYRVLVDNSPDAIVIYQDNKIVFANNESLRLVGAESIENLLGKSLLEFVHPDSRAFVIERMRKIAKKETVLPIAEEKIVRFDGSKLEVEVKAVPIVFELKPAVQLIIRNITERKQAEEELRLQSEIMSNMSEAIYMITMADGIIVYVNHVFEKMFGYEHDEMIGQHASIVNAPTEKSPQQSANEIMEDINEHGFWKGEVENIRKDGTVFTCYASVTLFEHSKFGKVILAIHTDISERKQAELTLIESEKKYRFIVENVGEGIGFVNADEEFVVANPAAESIFGVGKGELIGKNLKGFLSEEQYLAILNQTTIRKKGQESTYEFELTRPDGKKRNVFIIAVPQFDDNNIFIGTHGIFRDVTESKQAELALKETGQRLLQLNADKDRFISILGHDLKNPFNNILGFSEILTNEIESLNKEEIKDIAKNINKSAQITNNLLEEILVWARTQQGKIPFKPQILSFRDICKIVLEILKPNADAKNISFNCSSEDHINVFADIDMLKTVLRNLVSNAIKFTNNGGAIKISAKQTHSEITISVSDNGIGITPDNLTKLFNISEVITTKGTEKETGTGLGLLLCKEFVEKHGGRIWVKSTVDKGSTFYFTVPYK
jgi:PAS domain S-box-containing protein